MSSSRPRKILLAFHVGKRADGRNVIHAALNPRADEAFHWPPTGAIRPEGAVIVPELRNSSAALLDRLISYAYAQGANAHERWLTRHLEEVFLQAYACGKTGGDLTMESLMDDLLAAFVSISVVATKCDVNEESICWLFQDVMQAAHVAGVQFAKSVEAASDRPLLALHAAAQRQPSHGPN